MEKTYGDSVYASMRHGMVVLTTENGYADDPRNEICLEPEVLAELWKFVENAKGVGTPSIIESTPGHDKSQWTKRGGPS